MILDANCSGKLKLRLCGELCRVLTNQCSCQVLRKICINDSLAKFISLVVQIYLAVLAIANSFGKLCLTANENNVAWHELDEYESKIKTKTERRIFPINEFLLKKKDSCLDSIKICSLNIS